VVLIIGTLRRASLADAKGLEEAGGGIGEPLGFLHPEFSP
jgi:hypothetical protein